MLLGHLVISVPPEGGSRSQLRVSTAPRPPALFRKPTTNVRLSSSYYRKGTHQAPPVPRPRPGLPDRSLLSRLVNQERSCHCNRGSAKALTLQRLPSRVIANATQEFVQPRCRMVGDAAQHVGKPSLPSDEPSSARARPDRPSGFLRCSEHVPSTSRAVPERCPKRPGNRISHGQGRFWACAVPRRRFPVGARPTRRFAPAGSNRSSHGGNEMAEAFD